MNKLVVNIQNYNNVNVVSSQDVAIALGKNHSDVTRKIKEVLTVGEFSEREYKTSKGNTYTELLLTKDGFILLCMNYQGYNEFKRAYIDEFNRMEKALSELGEKERLYLGLFNKDPLVVANSHKALVELETKPLIATIEKQETKIKNLFEQIEDLVEKGRNTTFDIGTAAKLLNYKGLGKTRLFSLLRKQGVLCKNNDPMQKYIDNKYMILVSKPHPYMDEMYKQTRVTVKGLFALGRMLAKWGYESNISEQELIEDIRNLVG